MATGTVLKSMNFEVFGRVQGVYFRKHTQAVAKKNGIVGWVQNSHTHTVVGVAQGPPEKIEMMKKWLETKGSPKSRIDKAEFRNEKIIKRLEFRTFKIMR